MTLASLKVEEAGMRVPHLGLGCAPLGNLYQALAADDAQALLTQAWRSGIRYFDTAPLYGFGLSEARLGTFLKSHVRSEFFVSTKVGRRLVDNTEWHPQREFFIDAAPQEPVFDYSYDGVMASVEESLERLQLDTIDLLLMHDVGVATHGADHRRVFQEAMTGGLRAMRELRASGTVKAIGLGVNEWQVCDEAMPHADWDCFLLAGRYTLLEQEPLNGFFERCREKDIELILAGAFNSGILATGSCSEAKYNYGAASATLLSEVRRLEDICKKFGTELPAAAIQFSAAHPAAASLVLGLRTPDEVSTALKNYRVSIRPEFWADLKETGILPKSAPVPMGARHEN